MITLGPVREKEQIQKLFAERKISCNDFCDCVAALDGEKVLGLCLYELDNEKIIVRHLEPTDDIALADGILRSTLHVAAERSIMKAYYENTVPEDFLRKIGFIKDKEEKSLDIEKLFKSCCGCQQ